MQLHICRATSCHFCGVPDDGPRPTVEDTAGGSGRRPLLYRSGPKAMIQDVLQTSQSPRIRLAGALPLARRRVSHRVHITSSTVRPFESAPRRSACSLAPVGRPRCWPLARYGHRTTGGTQRPSISMSRSTRRHQLRSTSSHPSPPPRNLVRRLVKPARHLYIAPAQKKICLFPLAKTHCCRRWVDRRSPSGPQQRGDHPGSGAGGIDGESLCASAQRDSPPPPINKLLPQFWVDGGEAGETGETLTAGGRGEGEGGKALTSNSSILGCR